MMARDLTPALPRIGFLGAGRIGLIRMRSLLDAGLIDPVAVSDPVPEMVTAALELAPQAMAATSIEHLLEHDLDGLVIATPSAMHAEQAIQALKRHVAVFCQKPLGRTEEEARAVVEAARAADRLLGLDLSYRHAAGMAEIRELVRTGELGEIFAIDLVFHNAYGPDKPWFFDKALSGGGCVMDLGVHLVDLALWALDFPRVESVTGHLFSKGRAIARDSTAVEDFARATLTLETGTVVRIACSWHLHAGCDAVIGADFHGTAGGASFGNRDGSFFEFAGHRHRGTSTESLPQPRGEWWGGAIGDWARRLAEGERFDPAAEQFVTVAQVLDRIYAR